MQVNEKNLKYSKHPRKIATGGARIHECRLEQNVPNPFREFTEIQFSINRQEPVKLLILNHRKKCIHHLFEGRLRAGSYSIFWDGRTADGEPVAEGRYYL